jgi:hypothetical protein
MAQSEFDNEVEEFLQSAIGISLNPKTSLFKNANEDKIGITFQTSQVKESKVYLGYLMDLFSKNGCNIILTENEGSTLDIQIFDETKLFEIILMKFNKWTLDHFIRNGKSGINGKFFFDVRYPNEVYAQWAGNLPTYSSLPMTSWKFIALKTSSTDEAKL